MSAECTRNPCITVSGNVRQINLMYKSMDEFITYSNQCNHGKCKAPVHRVKMSIKPILLKNVEFEFRYPLKNSELCSSEISMIDSSISFP